MIVCMVACIEHRFRDLTERSSFALSYADEKEGRQESRSQGRSKEARSSEEEGRQEVEEALNFARNIPQTHVVGECFFLSLRECFSL